MLKQAIIIVSALNSTDPEEDQHVHSGAEREDLRTQRFAPHRPHRERHEGGILYTRSYHWFGNDGFVNAVILCLFPKMDSQIFIRVTYCAVQRISFHLELLSRSDMLI